MPINFIFNSTALLSSDSKAISYSGGHTGDAKHKEKSLKR